MLSFFLLGLLSCENGADQGKKDRHVTLFNQLDAHRTGIAFNNALQEGDSLNYFNYPYIYMGGGVAVADFNNDGATDIYLTGNMVDNALYLNQGNLRFTDATHPSNTALKDVWCTGVTVVDINNDGLLDLYVSVAGKFPPFTNKLLVNLGVDGDAVPRFKEAAKEYGIADGGHSEQSVFFDYDNDGDLDLFVANYPETPFKIPVDFYAGMMRNPQHISSSHLYRNNGDHSFTDVTEEAGLLSFGLSIGISVSDLNHDGYKDIYVSNDFASPDFIYFNNGDGTFTDRSKEVVQQTSFYGMGTDIADFNNDGLFDIVQLDMAPMDHQRSKENMGSMNPEEFAHIVDLDMHHQYMYNTLQLNRGLSDKKYPVYSNIAAFSGVKSTDWSWAALFVDVDHDGQKDLFVSNGSRRDIHNNDYFNQFEKGNYFPTSEKGAFSTSLIENMPSEALVNFMFKNNGDLTFTNRASTWGITDKTFANGAAYADFDNDGDMDLVVNNIDGPISMYENRATEKRDGHFLKVKFVGPAQNRMGIGNLVHTHHGGTVQLAELMLTRGYQSSVEPVVHFGLRDMDTVDSLTVTWPNGTVQTIHGVSTNQTLTVTYPDMPDKGRTPQKGDAQLFQNITAVLNLGFVHQEDRYNDYALEPLLPHKMSQFGPGIAVADVNADGLDDFWVGGASQQAGKLFVQNRNGSFSEVDQVVFMTDSGYEDMDGLFLDADRDGDMDLYVVSGGNSFPKDHKQYQDRLYVNDGEGHFERDVQALPTFFESGSRVIPLDYDGDGDLDLFVGSRLVPQRYPMPPTSYMLENQSGASRVQYTVAKSQKVFQALGLVTDALAMDIDGDRDQDLVVVGEWMPITFFENRDGQFQKKEDGIDQNAVGWWYSIAKADLDGDGDEDLIAGNLGENYKYKASREKTFDVFANDFDGNGHLDIVLGYYQGKIQYPVRGRECSSQQIPMIKEKFKNYKQFANAKLVDIYTEEKLVEGLHYKAQSFASAYLTNTGGVFTMQDLPKEAQFSSINAIVPEDVNGDGQTDVVVAGNLFVSEAETPRNDASIGLLMLNGENGLQPTSLSTSGLLAKGDVKNMQPITIQGKKCLLLANNNDSLQVFALQ
ncbi:MAG: VCBS repeat-containing protein [Flavobacteriaceae bacterium]